MKYNRLLHKSFGSATGYLNKGWTMNHIKDTATYRAFNDNRGQWILKHKGVGREKEMWRSLPRPFDESIILWHLATDFCFYTVGPSAAWRCREISNYVVYLLFVNPEMLMTGARRSLFREAYTQLRLTLEINPQVGGARPALDQERVLALKIADNIQLEPERQDVSIVHDAWRLASDLLSLRGQHNANDENMWEVIQGVWVEMLCFSAGRCRGYLHAKSLGQGGEYLSYIWLLLSYMGMETMAEKMQRTELQEKQATNNNSGSNSGTTETSPLIPTGGSGNATEASMQVTPPGGHGDDITPASIMMPTGDDSTAAAATTTTIRGGANYHMEVELTQQRL